MCGLVTDTKCVGKCFLESTLHCTSSPPWCYLCSSRAVYPCRRPWGCVAWRSQSCERFHCVITWLGGFCFHLKILSFSGTMIGVYRGAFCFLFRSFEGMCTVWSGITLLQSQFICYISRKASYKIHGRMSFISFAMQHADYPEFKYFCTFSYSGNKQDWCGNKQV